MTSQFLEELQKRRGKGMYPHLDCYVNSESYLNDFSTYENLTDFLKNAAYTPIPFIKRVESIPKYAQKVSVDGQKYRRRENNKKRVFKYPGHKDSLVHWAYSYHLKEVYENIIASKGLSNSIIAYRSIPSNKGSVKSVKDFASDLFDFIEKQPGSVVFLFDIKGYFDNIDHAILRTNWLKVLNKKTFTQGEQKLFKHITRAPHIELTRLRRVLRIKHSELTQLTKRNNGSLCDYKKLRNIIKKYPTLVSKNLTNKGIPQGSALSPLLANIYLLRFDEFCMKYAKSKKGLYRRYSDDILIALPNKSAYILETPTKISDMIANLNLEIKGVKTEIIAFNQYFGHWLAHSLQGPTSLRYLGWEYDGRKRLLRAKTLANHYRKIKSTIKRFQLLHLTNKSSIKEKHTKKTEGKFFKNFADYEQFSANNSDGSINFDILRASEKANKNIARYLRGLNIGK